MKGQYVAEFADGTRVSTSLVVLSKEMRAARSGDAYLTLEFSDRTGKIPGVLFRPSAGAAEVPVGSVADVVGVVTRYRGVKRVSVDSITPAPGYAPEDYLGRGPRPVDELVEELRTLVGSVREPGLKRILRAIFGDKEFFGRFSECPASQGYHHAYLGGLIAHTVAVGSHCRWLAEVYPQADRDLLVTAALLHDVGKVDELAFDAGIGYTDSGRLLGHVFLGSQRIRAVAQRCGRLDSDLLMRLEHAVLSHHGELEWGAPKRPSTLEALLLHHADNLDAKAAGFCELLGGALAAQENWTDASNLFRRPLYAPKAAADDRPWPVEEDLQYHKVSA